MILNNCWLINITDISKCLPMQFINIVCAVTNCKGFSDVQKWRDTNAFIKFDSSIFRKSNLVNWVSDVILDRLGQLSFVIGYKEYFELLILQILGSQVQI